MPIEQLVMSTMAVLMLMTALMGANVMANPIGSLPPRQSETQAPAQSPKIECTIELIEIKELKLIGRVDEERVEFKLVPQVRVTKDQKPAKLESLARGDFAILTLASASNDVVVRIEAVSSR